MNLVFAAQPVSCPLCGTSETSVIATVLDEPAGFELPTSICHGCGLVFSSQQPDQADLERFYAGEYRRLYHGTVNPEATTGQLVARSRSILGSLEPLGLRGKRLLEVGCAAGGTLVALRQRGAIVQGIEPTVEYARFARDTYGLTVHVGGYETFKPSAPFDVIVLSHVLEHLPAPVDALRHLRNWLTPEGVLYVEVPNFLSYPWLEIAHLWNFVPNTLRRTLRRAGFDLVSERIHSDRLGPRGIVYRGFFVSVLARPGAVTDEAPSDWRDVLRRRDRNLRAPSRRVIAAAGKQARRIIAR